MAEITSTSGKLTIIGRKKTLQARAGIIPLPTIKGMVFGNGGTNEDGSIKVPSETGLYNEFFRKENLSHDLVTDTRMRYLCELGYEDIPNTTINEIGLYDSDGDIFAVKTIRKKEKDPDAKMQFWLDDTY